MKIFIGGSNEISPDYMFISDEETYNFNEILTDMIDEIETETGKEVILLSRGTGAGVDAMVNIFCNENNIELRETTSDMFSGSNSEIMRDIKIANECDAGVLFCIKYQKLKGTYFEKLYQLLADQGKLAYIFSMEKYS